MTKPADPKTDCKVRVYRSTRDITGQADGENTLAGLPPHSDPEREPIPQALGSEPCCRGLGGAPGRPELDFSSSELVRQQAVGGICQSARYDKRSSCQ